MRRFGIQKGEETELVSGKQGSVGGWASDEPIQSGAANKMARETSEMPFKTVLGQEQVPCSPGIQTVLTWEDRQTTPNQVLPALY